MRMFPAEGSSWRVVHNSKIFLERPKRMTFGYIPFKSFIPFESIYLDLIPVIENIKEEIWSPNPESNERIFIVNLI